MNITTSKVTEVLGIITIIVLLSIWTIRTVQENGKKQSKKPIKEMTVKEICEEL